MWMAPAVAAMRLPEGTVLDGEAVIWHDGAMDFSAAQARAASTLERSRALAAQLPATYAVLDLPSASGHPRTSPTPPCWRLLPATPPG